jgi:hypothetical protein
VSDLRTAQSELDAAVNELLGALDDYKRSPGLGGMENVRAMLDWMEKCVVALERAHGGPALPLDEDD